MGRGVPPPEIGERAEKSSHSSLRGGSATKQSRAAPQTGLLRATYGARNDEPFSRRAFARELCQATLRDRHHRALTWWSMLKSNMQSAGGGTAQAYLPHGLPGLRPAMTKGNERKRFGGETPTDAMNILPWLTATAATASTRRTSIGVPPRFSSQGVFHRKGLSTRLYLPGTWRPVGWPSSGRYPPLPVPVQRTQSRPGRSAEGLMPECRPKAARGHRTRPREPGMPPGRDRIIRRDSKPYVTVTVTIVNEKRTKYFHAP